jgi:hypothetical protein
LPDIPGPHSMLEYLNPISSAAAAEVIPGKGSMESVRPGRVPGEAGGGGGGGRIEFDSAGARRGGPATEQPARPASKQLTEEERAAARARDQAEMERLEAKGRQKYKWLEGFGKPTSETERLGFKSTGAKKE